MIFLKFPRNYGKIFGFHTYNLKKRCELSLSFGKNYVGMNHGCESSVRLVFSVIFCVCSFFTSFTCYSFLLLTDVYGETSFCLCRPVLYSVSFKNSIIVVLYTYKTLIYPVYTYDRKL